MITLLEINKAINNKIEHALADSEFKTVPIIAGDLSEPIVRPSLKVSVYFFATDLKKYKIENTKVQDLIENEFLTPIKVTDTFYIDVDEVEANTSDTVLICSFNIETLEDIPEIIIDDGVEYEMMENLNLDLESEE